MANTTFTEATPGAAEGQAPGGWQGEANPGLADNVATTVIVCPLTRRIYTDATDSTGNPFPDGKATCFVGETPNIIAEINANTFPLSLFDTPSVQVISLNGSPAPGYNTPIAVNAADALTQPLLHALAQIDTSAFEEGFYFVYITLPLTTPNGESEQTFCLQLQVKALLAAQSQSSSSGSTLPLFMPGA